MIEKLKTASLFFLILIGNVHGDSGLPNLSIRPETQERAIDFFADALYWYTSETIDWAYTLKSSGNSVQTAYKTFVFDWAPGFSVGLGYSMEHDQWDTKVSYTCFESKATDHTSGTVIPAFLPARLSFLEPFSIGSATLNLHYNMFDWDLGRHFLISKHLALRPSIGLRGGWINQTLNSNWATPLFLGLFSITASEDLKQNFQAIGPKGGVAGKWCFGNIRKHSFSVIGQFDAFYLWGWWAIQDQFIDNLSTVIHLNTSDRNFGSLALHSFLGIGWDYNFSRDRFHFELELGYEIEDWLNQFQIFSDTSGAQNNDLILQGFNFGLRLDF